MGKLSELKEAVTTQFEQQVGPFMNRHMYRNIHADSHYLTVENIQDLANIREKDTYDIVMFSPLLNNIPFINESLRKVHDSMKWGGILVGRVETLEHRKRRIRAVRHKYVSKIIIMYEFIFRRVLPKLSGFRTIYTKSRIIKHHILSKCEILGRLRYCGFEIENLIESDKYLYFIASKNSTPLKEELHDGLVIKIPKVGKDERIFYCYKLRTMHAYASYLHDYILNNHKLDNNGKVIADFRKTNWGRFLRKTWLDEVPQILNILKGELSLIGLRPLSKTFLMLYPKDWRRERMKIKPGFVPPYYADCPKSFEEIVASEKRYYDLKKREPITTDIVYLLRVIASFFSGRATTG